MSCDASRNLELSNSTCVCKRGYAFVSASQGCSAPGGALDAVVNIVQVASLSSIGASALPIVLFSTSALMLQLFDILQMLRYILYVQIEYPPQVIDFFNFFGRVFNFEFIPTIIGKS